MHWPLHCWSIPKWQKKTQCCFSLYPDCSEWRHGRCPAWTSSNQPVWQHTVDDLNTNIHKWFARSLEPSNNCVRRHTKRVVDISTRTNLRYPSCWEWGRYLPEHTQFTTWVKRVYLHKSNIEECHRSCLIEFHVHVKICLSSNMARPFMLSLLESLIPWLK